LRALCNGPGPTERIDLPSLSKDSAERQVIVIATQSGSLADVALQEFLHRVRIAGSRLDAERIDLMGLDNAGWLLLQDWRHRLSFVSRPPRKFPHCRIRSLIS
jgi:hypothetical protein